MNKIKKLLLYTFGDYPGGIEGWLPEQFEGALAENMIEVMDGWRLLNWEKVKLFQLDSIKITGTNPIEGWVRIRIYDGYPKPLYGYLNFIGNQFIDFEILLG